MTDTIKLNRATTAFLENFSKTFASIANLTFPEQRAAIKEMFNIPECQLEAVARIEDIEVQGREASIPVRLFMPSHDGPLPVILYFHRGGWVYGSLQESEVICRRLANEARAIIAAVEYRLAPEYKFPVPLEDCYDAALWMVENASAFSGDPSKVILCGESAGGNLAAAVALMARETKQFTVAGQVLLYPILTSNLEMAHYDASPDKFLLSYGNMQFFWDMYLSSPQEGKNPLASPLNSENFAGLPPCLLVTAEHDALKHEGERYEKALRLAGVAIQAKCYPGVIHGFLDLPLAEATKKEAIRDIAAWVNLRHG